MKALTIWRPWTWAICHPSVKAKRVENRIWAAPAWMKHQQLAIHAGLSYDGDADRMILNILNERPPADCPTGIVAVAVVRGCISGDPTTIADPWYCGPIGWLLDDVRVLPSPVPCKGAKGLWPLPDDVEDLVLMQLGEFAP